MDRLEITSGVWLDARRAVWLAPERTLVVADLHLGYAWVQRRRGVLLPLADGDETGARLRALQRDYRPETVVFLGDLVHGAPGSSPLEAELRTLLGELSRTSRLVLTLGNHDVAVPELVDRLALPLSCVPMWRAGPHRLAHGDEAGDGELGPVIEAPTTPMQAEAAGACLDEVPGGPGLFLVGHEHPMIAMEDRVATHVRCPCFLEADGALMLPAFSRWAAGVVVGREPFMSPVARAVRWRQAVVILGDRLLRLPWSDELRWGIRRRRGRHGCSHKS